DAALSPKPLPVENKLLSVGSATFFLQIAMVYVFSALLKTGVEWRRDFSAVCFALDIDQFTRPLGGWMRGQDPRILKFLTAFTLHWEYYGPFLLLVPIFRGPIRTFVCISFIFMHWSFGSFMAIGPFTYITTIAWIAMFPSWAWDKLAARINWGRTACK